MAERFDERYAQKAVPAVVDPIVAFIADLTGSAAALEFGISPPFRYVWPSELDLMARLAGMTLRERWGGWEREPFTGESARHVSVWEKTAAGPF